MTRQLRCSNKAKPTSSTGLILANGGVLTYQHVVCLASHPRGDNKPYPSANPLPAGPPPQTSSPPVSVEAEGVATIEVRLIPADGSSFSSLFAPRSDPAANPPLSKFTDLHRRLRARRLSAARPRGRSPDVEQAPLPREPRGRKDSARAEQYDRRASWEAGEGME